MRGYAPESARPAGDDQVKRRLGGAAGCVVGAHQNVVAAARLHGDAPGRWLLEHGAVLDGGKCCAVDAGGHVGRELDAVEVAAKLMGPSSSVAAGNSSN